MIDVGLEEVAPGLEGVDLAGRERAARSRRRGGLPRGLRRASRRPSRGSSRASRPLRSFARSTTTLAASARASAISESAVRWASTSVRLIVSDWSAGTRRSARLDARPARRRRRAWSLGHLLESGDRGARPRFHGRRLVLGALEFVGDVVEEAADLVEIGSLASRLELGAPARVAGSFPWCCLLSRWIAIERSSRVVPATRRHRRSALARRRRSAA